jgi:hypothetical protein
MGRKASHAGVGRCPGGKVFITKFFIDTPPNLDDSEEATFPFRGEGSDGIAGEDSEDEPFRS